MSSPSEDRDKGTAPAPEPKEPPAVVLQRRRVEQGPKRLLTIERIYRLVGLPPHWTGIFLAIICCLLLTFWEVGAGRMDEILGLGAVRGDGTDFNSIDPYGYFFALAHFVLLGYTSAAVVMVVRAARRNAHGIGQLVEPSQTARNQVAAAGVYSRPWIILAGICGVVIGALAPYLDVAVWQQHQFNPYDISIMTPEVFIQRAVAVFFGFFAGQFLYVALVEASRFNRLAAHVRRDELLEARTLSPFTRQGLTNVLAVIIFPAILLVFSFNEGLVPLLVAICVISLCFAGAGLLGPLLGIHDRVAAAKRSQLNWVNRELTQERHAMAEGGGERFVQLMAYRSYIESVREWPLDGGTLGRLLLYLAIPLASWVGAAFVERALDAALG